MLTSEQSRPIPAAEGARGSEDRASPSELGQISLETSDLVLGDGSGLFRRALVDMAAAPHPQPKSPSDLRFRWSERPLKSVRGGT